MPLPFARLKIRYGEPIYLSREDTRDDSSAVRRNVEAKLRECTDALDEEMGLGAIPPDPRELGAEDG